MGAAINFDGSELKLNQSDQLEKSIASLIDKQASAESSISKELESIRRALRMATASDSRPFL